MNDRTLPTTRELARLKPAQVAVRPVQDHRAPAPRRAAAGQRVETLVGTRRALNLELRRLGSRLVDTGVERVIESGPQAGLLELRVIVQEPAKHPRWAKVCLGTGLVLAPASALTITVWWLLTTLTLASLAGFVAVVLVVLGILARLGRGSDRARGVFVQVNTSVHIR